MCCLTAALSLTLWTVSAEDLTAPVRPGGVGGQPFWNGQARQFLYAPSFGFKPVKGAASYRFTVRDAKGLSHVFQAEKPTATLAPVWLAVAPGPAKVEVVGLDAGGKVLGKSGERAFHRAAPFAPKAYPPAACDYAASARRAFEWLFTYAPVASWKANVFDKTYQLNCFPSKMIPAVMFAAARLGELDPKSPLRAERLAMAENAARWLRANAVREPASMRGLPITYCDYWAETKHLGDLWNSKKIAHDKRNEVMMTYPAYAGRAYLRLAKATGKGEFLADARRIGESYLAVQRKDGSWPLLLEIGTGRELVPNSADASVVIRFLDALSEATGDGRYRAAGARSVPSLEARVKSFDWEGQFEDMSVQRRPYTNLSKDIAINTCLALYGRAPNAQTLANLREAMRFAEDQFVIWGAPRKKKWYVPGVIEQYNCEETIDASYAIVIRGYLALWRAEHNPLDLAKARALGDAITRNQFKDGNIPTVFPSDPQRKGRNWLNCVVETAESLCELDAAVSSSVVAAGVTEKLPTMMIRVRAPETERPELWREFMKIAAVGRREPNGKDVRVVLPALRGWNCGWLEL